jgi:type II secretory pathway pseudopilin PulG
MKKGFTLVDLLVIVVIIGILGTFALPAYLNVVENAKEKACQTNLEVLLGALEAFGLENDQLPGTLGQLKKDHLEKSWAKVLAKPEAWKIKLAYFISDLDKHGLAYAQGWVERYIGSLNQFICPKDDDGLPSYGLNATFVANISFRDYQALPVTTIIIADSQANTFPDGTIEHRHLQYTVLSGSDDYGIGVANNGGIIFDGLGGGTGGR